MERKERGPLLSILPATKEDVPALDEIQREAWLATYPNDASGITREDILARDWGSEKRLRRWEDSIEAPDVQILVAKEDDKTVGYIILREEEETQWVRALYVHPHFQSRGHGTRLMKEMTSRFDHARDVLLTVATYNKQAIAFYEKFGFENRGAYEDEQMKPLPSGRLIPVSLMVLPGKH